MFESFAKTSFFIAIICGACAFISAEDGPLCGIPLLAGIGAIIAAFYAAKGFTQGDRG